MTRQFENPQPSLFDEDEPRVELAPAEKIGLATLVKALLLEIAARNAAAFRQPSGPTRRRGADGERRVRVRGF
jgi:hypothetical protein